ncbi:uncharacterized protein EV422DRAFT_508709 [Fimicolochytrium jonesii]|uniref:uncharacterized protein n=1 Tax=Fimicolochytrium jonesii TaxID=1396493 RepID=UPI0022FE1F41|nr:uncharacterized protein EV422DRAFT_508709 [Fimicolochytrium jonesii]KAI8817887.1 hypothetical protein EV422DRAFT_508709 [Fimicolochytrium jonesii]
MIPQDLFFVLLGQLGGILVLAKALDSYILVKTFGASFTNLSVTARRATVKDAWNAIVKPLSMLAGIYPFLDIFTIVLACIYLYDPPSNEPITEFGASILVSIYGWFLFCEFVENISLVYYRVWRGETRLLSRLLFSTFAIDTACKVLNQIFSIVAIVSYWTEWKIWYSTTTVVTCAVFFISQAYGPLIFWRLYQKVAKEEREKRQGSSVMKIDTSHRTRQTTKVDRNNDQLQNYDDPFALLIAKSQHSENDDADTSSADTESQASTVGDADDGDVERAYLLALWVLVLQATTTPDPFQGGANHADGGKRTAYEEMVSWDDNTLRVLMKDLWTVLNEARQAAPQKTSFTEVQRIFSTTWKRAIHLINAARAYRRQPPVDEASFPPGLRSSLTQGIDTRRSKKPTSAR